MMTNMDKIMDNDISRGASLSPFTYKIQDADVTINALSTLNINTLTTQAMGIKDNVEIVVDMTCVSKLRHGHGWPQGTVKHRKSKADMNPPAFIAT